MGEGSVKGIDPAQARWKRKVQLVRKLRSVLMTDAQTSEKDGRKGRVRGSTMRSLAKHGQWTELSSQLGFPPLTPPG